MGSDKRLLSTECCETELAERSKRTQLHNIVLAMAEDSHRMMPIAKEKNAKLQSAKQTTLQAKMPAAALLKTACAIGTVPELWYVGIKQAAGITRKWLYQPRRYINTRYANKTRIMALMLTLPLVGLKPEHFSTLNLKLLKLENELNSRNSPDSARASSPSTGSETSGISSLVLSGESASAELTPVSSRPETPTKVPYKEKTSAPSLRIMHGGRDILNLGANIRPSFNWERTDRKLSRYEIQNIIVNRSVHYRAREQPHDDYSMKRCDECGFCESSCVF